MKLDWLRSQFRCWLKHGHSTRPPYRWAFEGITETQFGAAWDEELESFLAEQTKVAPTIEGGCEK